LYFLLDLELERVSRLRTLFNKYANISGELKYGTLDNTNILKKLSGNDQIRAQKKHQHPFDFINHAKLIFATNELPKTTDRTDSFYRRILLIEFPYQFTGDKEKKDLIKKIPKKEFEGLAFKCASMLKGMNKKGFAFTNEKTLSEVQAEYEDLTNPIVTFLREFCLEDKSSSIPKQEFKDKLTSWLDEKNMRKHSDQEIKKEMSTLGYSDYRPSSGDRQRVWNDLKWKEQQGTNPDSDSVQDVQDYSI
jgi:phage/plasmid-associated DNA primase